MDTTPGKESSSSPADQSRLIEAAFQQVSETRQPGLPSVRIRTALRGYQLREEWRRGAQGTVYLAVQEGTGREVAVKVMHASAGPDRSGWARFEREVKVLGRLRHPNIVTIHDSGVVDGEAYFVMDFIRGTPLDTWHGVPTTRADVREVLGTFVAVCDAANEAHLRGIIHRDLKPGNILVDPDGDPHILDFGLAKLLDDSNVDNELDAMTQTGQFVGSLPWASPEQADGRQVDIRTDVYALGVLLYQLLTGSPPYPVNIGVRAVIDNILHATPERPSRLQPVIDDELESILLQCLHKEPERRYQTAGELARDLRRYLAGDPVDAKRDSGLYMLRKQVRRHRTVISIAGLLLVTLIGSSIVSWALFAEARTRLRESYLAQARAGRTSNRVGRRFDSLAALGAAASIRPGINLRDEAAASLLLSDLREVGRIDDVRLATANGQRQIERIACFPRPGQLALRDVDGATDPIEVAIPDGTIRSTLFSPMGTAFAVMLSGSDGERLLAFDAATGRVVQELDASHVRGPGLAFLNETELVATSHDGVLVCRLDGGSPRRISVPGRSEFLAAAPDGRRFAVVSYDEDVVEQSTLTVLDVDTEQVIHEKVLDTRVYRVEWCPDGRLLAGPALDFDVYLWNTADWSLERTLSGHEGAVVDVFFHPAADLIVTSSWDDTARLWNLRSGRQLFEPIEEASPVGFDGRLFMREYDGRGLRIWEYVDNTPCRRFEAARLFGVEAAAEFLPRGGIVTAGDNGVWYWPTEGDSVEPTQLTASASWTAVLSDRLNALVTTVEEGVQLHPVLEYDSTGLRLGAPRLLHAETGLTLARLLPDERRLLLCGDALKLLDLETGELRFTLEGFRGMERPDITPDGRWVFAGNWLGRGARVYDAESGEVVLELPGRSVRGVFSPDGRILLVSDGGSHRFLEVGTWREIRSLPRKRDDYRLAAPIAFSPDGSTVALMHSRYDVRLVDTATGEPLITLPNPDYLGLISLDFHPDGTKLAMMTTGQTWLVWDLAELLAELQRLDLDW